MPNDQDTQGDELQLEVIPETETVEGSQDTQESEGETEDNGLNLETDEPQVDKLSPAEENAKRQEEAWLNKVILGKAQVEEAPKWLQNRLNSRLEATNKVPATEELIEKALAKKEAEREFKARQKQIPKLTPQQAKELNERFNALRPAGKVVALNAALDAMGLSQKIREAEERGVAKGRMSLPKSGQPSVRKSEQVVGGVPLDVIGDDKRWNEMIRNGSMPQA